MSALPEHAPVPPAAPGPAAAAQLLARIREHRLAERWAPAFKRDWDKALEDSRHSYSLAPCHEVIRSWQARLESAPAVENFTDSGRDDTGFTALDDVLGARG